MNVSGVRRHGGCRRSADALGDGFEPDANLVQARGLVGKIILLLRHRFSPLAAGNLQGVQASQKPVFLAVAQFALTSINGPLAFLYYVVAGLGWVLPAMPLIRWMSKPDA